MIGIYARVSTIEQTKGYSIDEQIDRLKKYCEAIGQKDFIVYVDGGYSGASMERPELQRMIQDAKDGKIEKVLVYKLDRLSRSQKDTLYLIEDVFLKSGVHFESISERFDTGTALGMAMIGILAVFAQLEREQIKERMTIGREGRAKNGKYHGGFYDPVGYDYKDGELIVNDFEAMQVKTIFEMFVAGSSVYKITRFLNDHGYNTKHGIWNDKTARKALRNNIYIGKITFKGEVYDGNHKPIISNELFEKAQERLKETAGRSFKAGNGLLAGLIYCKECGARYGRFKSRYTKTGYHYEYYYCYSRNKVRPSMVKDPNCKAKAFPVEELNNIILNEVKKLSMDPDYLEQIAETSERKSNFDKAEVIRKEIDRISAQRSRLIDLYGVGGVPVEELSEKIKLLNTQRDALFEQLDELTNDNMITVEEARDAIKDFSDIVERGNVDELRNVLQNLIDRIELGDNEIIIKWRFT